MKKAKIQLVCLMIFLTLETKNDAKSKSKTKKSGHIILMATFHTFPSVLADLSVYFFAATAYLNSTPHLLIKPAKLEILNPLMTGSSEAWDVIYPTSIGDNSSHNFRTKRNTLIGKIEHSLLDIYDNIAKDLWTVDDRSTLRRPLKSEAHVNSKEYPNSPTIETYNIQHLGITLKLTNPATPETQEVPAKQHMYLETFVGKAGIADADIPWTDGENVTHFLYTHHYSDSQVGLTAYFHVCYESTRKERSVFSIVHSVAIA
jgi:hypothetical protein